MLFKLYVPAWRKWCTPNASKDSEPQRSWFESSWGPLLHLYLSHVRSSLHRLIKMPQKILYKKYKRNSNTNVSERLQRPFAYMQPGEECEWGGFFGRQTVTLWHVRPWFSSRLHSQHWFLLNMTAMFSSTQSSYRMVTPEPAPLEKVASGPLDSTC